MDTLTRSVAGLVVSLGLLIAGAAVADSPVKIGTPDSHSMEVTGKVSLYRVQMEGATFGKGKDKAHTEILISLDSKPGMIYTLSLHNANNGAATVDQEMAKTLRAAYVRKSPVTLYHQTANKKDNNFKIQMVQLD